MQDTLLYLTQGSVKKFTSAIKSFLPIDVQVIDAFVVWNRFITEEEEKKREEDPYASKEDPIPLFSVDLIL